jgi:hypothetical protein
MTLFALQGGKGGARGAPGEVGARRHVVSPHLTPAHSAPRGGEGEK